MLPHRSLHTHTICSMLSHRSLHTHTHTQSIYIMLSHIQTFSYLLSRWQYPSLVSQQQLHSPLIGATEHSTSTKSNKYLIQPNEHQPKNHQPSAYQPSTINPIRSVSITHLPESFALAVQCQYLHSLQELSKINFLSRFSHSFVRLLSFLTPLVPPSLFLKYSLS
jgi:hypothetical protein